MSRERFWMKQQWMRWQRSLTQRHHCVRRSKNQWGKAPTSLAFSNSIYDLFHYESTKLTASTMIPCDQKLMDKYSWSVFISKGWMCSLLHLQPMIVYIIHCLSIINQFMYFDILWTKQWTKSCCLPLCCSTSPIWPHLPSADKLLTARTVNQTLLVAGCPHIFVKLKWNSLFSS